MGHRKGKIGMNFHTSPSSKEFSRVSKLALFITIFLSVLLDVA